MEKKINKIDIGRLRGRYEEYAEGRCIGTGDDTEKSIRFVAEKVNEIVGLINKDKESEQMETEIIRLKMQNYADRDNMISALTNTGIKSWVEIKEHQGWKMESIYYIAFEVNLEKE